MTTKLKGVVRRIVQEHCAFICEICGKTFRSSKRFEFRSQQYIDDHIPRLLTNVCRNCCYKESFGTKGLNKRKRENQIEMESHLYVKD